MKIKKAPKDAGDKRKSILLDLPLRLVVEVDKAAKKNSVSRRALVEAILVQVLNDKEFVVELP